MSDRSRLFNLDNSLRDLIAEEAGADDFQILADHLENLIGIRFAAERARNALAARHDLTGVLFDLIWEAEAILDEVLALKDDT